MPQPARVRIGALLGLVRAALTVGAVSIALGCGSDPATPDAGAPSDGGRAADSSVASDASGSDGAREDAGSGMTWRVAVLPDTQYYARDEPALFEAHAAWVRDERDRLRTQFVLHLGDIVDDNSVAQWSVAERALDQFEGVLPLALAVGNHDLGTGGSADTRDTRLNDHFDYDAFVATHGLVESHVPGRLENALYRMPTPTGDWLVLSLEFGPRPDVLAWAARALEAHPVLPTILITHAYLYEDDTRYDARTRPDQFYSPYSYGVAAEPGGVQDGQEIFDALVWRFGQIEFVLCGHVLGDGLGRLTSAQEDGGFVHQLLSNFQERERGGEGWLRLLEIDETSATVRVRTVSSQTSAFIPGAPHDFTLPLDR